MAFIHFTAEEEISEDASGARFSNEGCFLATENALTIRIKAADYQSYKKILEERAGNESISSADEEFIRGLIENEIVEVFDHELAHYAHRQRLSISWLREWYEITEQEKVYITPYVERVSHKDNPKHHHYESEDLADSTSTFTSRPAKLLMEARRRFAILNERDERYEPSVVSALARMMDNKIAESNGKLSDQELESFSSLIIEFTDRLHKQQSGSGT